MKIRKVAATAIGSVLMFLCGASVCSAITVEPGSPLILSFSNLPLVQIGPGVCCGGQGNASINLTSDLLVPGDTIRLEMFENSLAEIPFYTHDFTEFTEQFGAGVVSVWPDVQGVIRLTALSGSINVDNIVISVYPDTVYPDLRKFAQTFDFTAPLPAAFPLFATGLGALGLIVWRRKKRVNA